MESSKIFGDHGAEECQSSESGWTMYIGSPISDEEDDDDSHGMKKNHVYDHDDEYIYDGSDDSMASDASSGPSHKPWEGNEESGHGMVHKYDKEDKVVKKHVKKKKTGFEEAARKKETKEVTEKRGIVTVQSGNMARYIGQRKK